MSLITAQDLPRDLLVFPKAQHPNPACVRCTCKHYPGPVAGIHDMSAADCPWCSILGRAIVRAERGNLNTIIERPGGSTCGATSAGSRPDGFLLMVEGAVIKIHYMYRGTLGHDVEKIFLYTQLGQAKCSDSVFDVAPELECSMSTYKDIITGWLETCHAEHSFCPKWSSPLPSRVLDVGPINSDQIRLYVSKGDSAPYTALTYCWCNGQTVITLTKNYEIHQKGIPVFTLPRTLVDAVTITRALGIRYLWVDALCIIQDDGPDWGIESGNMAAIYQNAYLVISADSAADVNEGFLAQTGHRAKGVPIAFVKRGGATIYARSKHIHGNPTPLFRKMGNGPPVQKRAWTLRERVLANRPVHFAGTEMLWECQSSLRCECIELDNGHSSLDGYESPDIE
jgi:hypothetical protein